MARVGRLQGSHEGLTITHFTHHDDVGILAHDMDERALKAQRVEADFALFNDRLFIFKHEFNGIFDRDDVALFGLIYVIDHCRHGARFAAAGGPGDENDPAVGLADLRNLRWQMEVFKRWYVGLHIAHGNGWLTALVENVG